MSWNVEWHDELPSTMERARDLAESGAPGGTVVVANFQTHGRGTRGREWNAAPGSCLMCTVLVRPDIEPSATQSIPRDVAGSLAGFIERRFAIDATVSPPNDVHIGAKKVCGVLCTSRVTGDRLDWLLCGIGLNTIMTREQLPVSSATSLAIEGVGCLPAHEQLLPELLDAIAWLLSGRRLRCAGYADKPIL